MSDMVSAQKVVKKGSLTRGQILEHAYELLKEGGAGAVSMRRVADSLGVATMSLYTHVKNKEDLLEGVLSLVLGQLEVEVDQGIDGWQDQVAAWMYSLRQQLIANPEILPLFNNKGRYSEAYLGAVDLLIAILRRAGFSESDIIKNVRLINWTVFGFVLIEASAPEEQSGTMNSVSRVVFEDIDGLFEHQVNLLLIGLTKVTTKQQQG